MFQTAINLTDTPKKNTTDGQIGQLGIVRYGSEEMRVFIT